MDRKALLVPCGLVLGTSYLATSIPTTFALDRPLHTIAAVLLLSGLAVVAYETRAAQTRRPHSHSHSQRARHVAIPLQDGNGRPSSEEEWSSEERTPQYRGLGQRALAVMLAALLCLLGARIALFHAVLKDVECAGPQLTAFLPLLLALFHAYRTPKDRSQPAWSAESSSVTHLDRFVHFFLYGTTRYILPSLLLAISSFITTLRTSVLRSTYICPASTSAASLVPKLQFLGFLVDCILVLLLYRLVDEGLSQSESNSPEPKDGTTVHGLIGFTFIASAIVLGIVGIVVYTALPEHREWLFSAPREYLLGLLRLSLMIPLTMLCFLVSARMYGVMGAVLIAAFSCAFIGVLRALAMGVSYSFPPKSTAGVSLCLTLLTIALVLQLVADAIDSGQTRPKMPVRLGRNQTVSVVALLVLFSIGVGVYRYQWPVVGHPIDTLLAVADEQHERWAFQAHQSKSLAQAVVRYQERYLRDPPPHFDKWYEFATNRDTIVIDDFDNIEEDLIPFSSLKPAELRRRTAEILAHNEDLGGIRVRDGKAEIFGSLRSEQKWMLDGMIHMIGKFVEFIPDMDLAFNLNDEPRVAVPYEQFQAARMHHLHYPEHTAADGTIDFRLDRASTWKEIAGLPRVFDQAGKKPSFQTYGSVACSPESRAQKERRWDTGAFCSACSAPHSMGAFVANWSLSASPCHQPDLANLHGFHLSPAGLSGTHDLVPIFSQSRAPGYADIRYPSPWNYLDRQKYEFGENYPDPNFAKKENVLFWRGEATEGVSIAGSWKGMLQQRFVHLLNNETSRQPIFLPTGSKNGRLEYAMEYPEQIKEQLETKLDARFVGDLARCEGQDCVDQKLELWLGKDVDLRDHWRYRYLFDTDGAGFSGRFLPFLQSNSVVFKTALFREWYEGRLTAWKHFVPVDSRLHDLFSSLAYFGGYSLKEKGKRTMEPKDKQAEAIARNGKVWTEKVLRKKDMEIYMFRLLLEWGRLTDDRRKDVGFRMDTKGRKGTEGKGGS
ncbi:glycosyltransferase family 90 protein [Karstenula rhodostoma CBS 690.94]|uniref:Glycosyltransferase family 90 protein n=1 Tax=Karstenula rhodostoma CBS 690.94 TaxID=1392251 RepID=A0A9P4UB75_9PLEO|nr:glycosyltransferase family 90 protein [Karstenula rhodostoma CBS 690.94]